MDFKRTQFLLFIVFLCFDIYLGFVLYSKLGTRVVQSSNNPTITIEQQLKNRNIKFATALSEETEMLPIVKANTETLLEKNRDKLQGQTTKYTNKQLQSTFDEPIDVGFGSLEGKNETLISSVFVPYFFIGKKKRRERESP